MTTESEEDKRYRENAAANGQGASDPLSFFMMLFELLFSNKTPNYVELDSPRPDAEKASVKSLQPDTSISLSSQNEYVPNTPENIIMNNLLIAARQEVGVKEVGKNGGQDVARFMETVGMENQGLPWCAGFISYVCNETMPGVINPTAGSLAMMNQFKEMGAYKAPVPGQSVDAGDIIFLDRGTATDGKAHVGLVHKVHSNGDITTIEGNKGDAVRYVTYSAKDLIEQKVLGFGDTRAAIRNKLSFNTQISIAEASSNDAHSPINTSTELEGSASMKKG